MRISMEFSLTDMKKINKFQNIIESIKLFSDTISFSCQIDTNIY